MQRTLAQLQRHGSACLCSECHEQRDVRKADDEGSWITVNGAHIHINGEGQADKGPKEVVSHLNSQQSGKSTVQERWKSALEALRGHEGMAWKDKAPNMQTHTSRMRVRYTGDDKAKNAETHAKLSQLADEFHGGPDNGQAHYYFRPQKG
jgi:hypothetical protein